jgi:hypothetical protein
MSDWHYVSFQIFHSVSVFLGIKHCRLSINDTDNMCFMPVIITFTLKLL